MITVCRDIETVTKFMKLPEIRRYSEEYGCTRNTIYRHDSKEFWLAYEVDGTHVGLINVHIETGTMCMLHPYILRVYKTQYTTMIMEFLSWFLVNMPENAIKINVAIPDFYKNTINIAKKCGFKVEGIDIMSYRTKDFIYDRILLGILREEIGNG